MLEVSSFVAAPLGGMTLGHLGADVIRIDPLGGAADQHRWPVTRDGTSLYWAGLNKGKRSVTLDLRAEEGRDAVRALLAQCLPRTAVVLTNSVGADWLSYERLAEIKPDVVHVQVRGRHDGAPAVDYTVNAEVGFPMVTGPAGHAGPVNHVLPAWDIACGLYAAAGVAAAARHRDLTGQGSRLTVALADVALAMAGNLGFLAEAQLNAVDRQRIGNHLYGGFARDFIARDGARFMVVALTRRHWADLVAATDNRAGVDALEKALAADFTHEDDRFEYREVLAGLFQHWFSAQSAQRVREVLAGTAVLWSQYRSFTEAVTELQQGTGHPLVAEIDQPGVGPHLAPGCPLVVDDVRIPPRPSPVLGEHTDEVLAGLTPPLHDRPPLEAPAWP